MHNAYLFTFHTGQIRLEQGRYFRLWNLLLLFLGAQALAGGRAGCDCRRQDSGKHERSSHDAFLPDISVDWSLKRRSQSLDQSNWTNKGLLCGGLRLGPNDYSFLLPASLNFAIHSRPQNGKTLNLQMLGVLQKFYSGVIHRITH